jgi:hypothetical protein
MPQVPEVIKCPECKKVINKKKDMYVVVGKRPMHPECKAKRLKASEAIRD